MKSAILIHGFNNLNNGKENIDKLRPYLEAREYKVFDLDYGWFGLIMSRLGNGRIAKKLAGMIQQQATQFDEVHVFGHSNGCAIMYRASKLLDPAEIYYHYINPALVASRGLEAAVQHLNVWYSPNDAAVKWARTGRKLNLVPPNWGGMGYLGYLGVPDTRVRNYNIEEVYQSITGRYKEFGHSDIFSHLDVLAPALLGAS